MNTGTLLKIGFWGGAAYIALSLLKSPTEQVAQYNNAVKDLQQKNETMRAEQSERVAAVSAEFDGMTMPDPALRQCINVEMQLRSHLIEHGSFTSITDLERLDCSHKKITNLQGLENFTALKELNLAYNDIEYVAPLQNLQNLEELNLSGNKKLKSLWMITSLPNIHTLKVGGLSLENPAHVFDFYKLKDLEIYFNNEQSCLELQNFFAAARSKSIHIQRPRECLTPTGEQVRF